MCLEVEIKLHWVDNVCVNHGASNTVATSIDIVPLGIHLGREPRRFGHPKFNLKNEWRNSIRQTINSPEMMSFGDDNKCDLGVDVECLACLSDDVEF